MLCRANSHSPARSVGASACECIVGWGHSVATCERCSAGTYKAQQGTVVCTPCAAGKHSALAGAERDPCTYCGPDTYAAGNKARCLACPSNSRSAASSDARTYCVCNPGRTDSRDVRGLRCGHLQLVWGQRGSITHSLPWWPTKVGLVT